MSNYNAWKVLYRIKSECDWLELEAEDGYWYADPMLIQYNGKIYLFTEAFSEVLQIGYLAVSEYVNNCFTKPKLIIKQRSHLSYPCVFEYKGDIYMVPETGQNGTLELWKAAGDLYHWNREVTLLTHVRYADTTVLKVDGKILLFSYLEIGEYSTLIYELDMDNKRVKLVEKIEHDSNQYRPAGNFYYKNEKLMRPVQYNLNSYGEKMILKEISTITPYKEYTVNELKASDYGKEFKGMGTHTYAELGDLVVVDVLAPVELPLYKRFVFIRKVRNLLFKIKYRLTR